MRRVFLICCILIIYPALSRSKEQPGRIYYSSSVADMVPLQHLKHALISRLEIYLQQLQIKLQTVQKGILQIETQLNNLQLEKDDQELSNFGILRHLHFDWTHWLRFMQQNVATEEQKYVQEVRPYFPLKEDLTEALSSVFLILNVYLIKPHDFAKGLLDGKQYNSRLDALDGYALAKFAYEQKYYEEAGAWFRLSWSFYQAAINLTHYRELGFKPAQFLQFYATYLDKMNKKVAAWHALDSALQMKPYDITIYRQLKMIELNLYTPNRPAEFALRSYHELHRECCRGEFGHPKGLTCNYDSQTHPFLRLAPFKVEMLNVYPFVAIYHEVLYDSEIETLYRISIPVIERSSTLNVSSNQRVVVQERTSNSVFLRESHSEVIRTVNRRTGDMTGLDVTESNADDFLVMNYGLGGQYAPHVDWFGPKYDRFQTRGDRVATVLFYLNDVPQGGATVFPHLRLAYFPKKGTALIFRNLDTTMTGERLSTHAGCPVLFGSKWAATKWIYSQGQMFRWPCKADKMLKQIKL